MSSTSSNWSGAPAISPVSAPVDMAAAGASTDAFGDGTGSSVCHPVRSRMAAFLQLSAASWNSVVARRRGASPRWQFLQPGLFVATPGSACFPYSPSIRLQPHLKQQASEIENAPCLRPTREATAGGWHLDPATQSGGRTAIIRAQAFADGSGNRGGRRHGVQFRQGWAIFQGSDRRQRGAGRTARGVWSSAMATHRQTGGREEPERLLDLSARFEPRSGPGAA